MTTAVVIAIIAALIVAALLLFLFELLTPSFGVMTAFGVAALAGAVYLAFAKIGRITGTVMTAAFVLAVPAYFGLLIKFLPRTAVTQKLFLRRTGTNQAAGTPEAEENKALIGKTGTTETQLRPAGAVRIDGRRIIAIAESGVIEKGQNVQVISLSGSNIVVRAVGKS